MTDRKVGLHFNRRAFLLAPASAAPLAGAGRRIDRGRVSVITDEIALEQKGAIEFARQYGLRWVELRSMRERKIEYFRLPEEDLKAAARDFAAAGLKVSFLNTSMLKYPMPGVEPANERHRKPSDRFEKRMEELQAAIRAAHILGVDKVRVFTFMRAVEPHAVYPRVAEIIGELAKVAEREKIHLLIENENACNVASCAELTALLKLIPSKYVGINWDPYNASNTKTEVAFPDGYRALPVKRIGNVQIKGRSILPGPGLMDWKSIFATLIKDGYAGQVGLETHIFGEGQIQASHDSMKEILRIVAES